MVHRTLERMAAHRRQTEPTDPGITQVRPTPRYDNQAKAWVPPLNTAEQLFVSGMEKADRAYGWAITATPSSVIKQAKEAAAAMLPRSAISAAGRIAATVASLAVMPPPKKDTVAITEYGYVPPEPEGVIANIAGLGMAAGLMVVDILEDASKSVMRRATRGLHNAGEAICLDVQADLDVFNTRLEAPHNPL